MYPQKLNLINQLLTLALLGTFAALLSGCGKAGVGIDTKAFDSAPPEAKAQWELAAAASKTNGYIVAVKALYDLKARENLSAKQKDSVAKALGSLTDTVFERAGNGDPKAAEALQELRKMSSR